MVSARTTTLQVEGLLRSSSQSRVRSALERRPGVLSAEPNAVAQTATVVYDPVTTSIAELAEWVRDCGLHCAGMSVPHHVCDAMADETGPLHEQVTRDVWSPVADRLAVVDLLRPVAEVVQKGGLDRLPCQGP